jgi:hypothetical protein
MTILSLFRQGLNTHEIAMKLRDLPQYSNQKRGPITEAEVDRILYRERMQDMLENNAATHFKAIIHDLEKRK